MDAMSKQEIEAVLSSRLPNCTICCSIHSDGMVTVSVTGPASEQFTVINIDRLQYRGDEGINKLAREIMEEMVISRQTPLL